MRKARVPFSLGALLAVFAAVALAVPPTAAAEVSDFALALRWAPIHYQDTDDSDADADYLSSVDFDGDWQANNNWEHQDDDASRLTGAAYFSVTETSTHWFIVYGFYHPRDWVDYPDLGLDHHENDMEGVLLTVRRDGSTHGTLEAAVTIAHTDFYSYTPAGSPYTSGRESIDGLLRTQSWNGLPHPTTFQEAKGHGLYAWNGGAFPGGDGVVYFPTDGSAEVPANGNDRSVPYRLIDVFADGGLWAHRNDPATFAFFGAFRGDNGVDNAASAPWRWDDRNDGDIPAGAMALDPARLVSAYFANEGEFSLGYTRNAYR